MKCPVCTSKKGKRGCLLTTSCICSQCCGTNRKKETCHPCGYYQDLKRDYKSIPCYSPNDMNNNFGRQDIANVIESAISSFDHEHGDSVRDELAIRIVEYLLDFYHFKQQYRNSNDALLDSGYHYVFSILTHELKDEPHEEITKILGAIYFVAKRRSQGGRQYLDLIKQYVGVRVGSGMRVIPMPTKINSN